MKNKFLVTVCSFLAMTSGMVQAQTAPAKAWPTQPIRMIVPFPGGASTLDAVVRLLSVEVGRDLANPVIVENKPGAGTVIGVDAVAKATDQHSCGGVANSFTVNQLQ